MSVQSPPSTTAAFIGMSSFDTLSRCFFAQSRIAGTIRATTGVLFMKAETTAGPTIVRSCAAASDCGRPSARSTTAASAPVRSTAAATTNSAATVSMPSLPMPRKASSGVRTPAASKATTPPIIAMSGARCPKSSITSVARTTTAVKTACQLCSNASKFMRRAFSRKSGRKGKLSCGRRGFARAKPRNATGETPLWSQRRPAR